MTNMSIQNFESREIQNELYLIHDLVRAPVNANFTRPCFETYMNFYDGFH